MNQSKLEANTCRRHEARENVRERVTISCGFTSDWLRKRRDFLNQSQNVVMQSENCYSVNAIRLNSLRKRNLFPSITCFCFILTSVISWNNKSGIVMVVMLCLTAVCRAFLKPTITGFRVLIVDDFTLSSTTRWNTTWTSARLECRVM